MKPLRLPAAQPGLADVAILCLLGGVIAMVVAFAREFEAPLTQAVQIDLRPGALLRYTLYSLSRGVLALVISYVFALGFGWAAAKSRAAERLLLPLLDILQSIPVLGFLPGLVLGLMSLFPARNMGLELAAILMIFTAQAWNLALSFYNSLKALPQPLRDACKVAGWPPGRTFRQLEVPAAAQGLVWNGMLSMAGGWFFLMVNEAFRLGNRDYRLPGIGSYMSVALDQGNGRAVALAIAAMVVMIVCVDQLLWRPLVVWVEKFRLDESSDGEPVPSSWVLEYHPAGSAVRPRASSGADDRRRARDRGGRRRRGAGRPAPVAAARTAGVGGVG
jgi:NitT/TauT family transport system permease protein